MGAQKKKIGKRILLLSSFLALNFGMSLKYTLPIKLKYPMQILESLKRGEGSLRWWFSKIPEILWKFLKTEFLVKKISPAPFNQGGVV